MNHINKDKIYECGYEIGFYDGYTKAISDLNSKLKNHIDYMIKNISKEILRGEFKRW